jgi:HEAT repeat protein
VSRPLERAGLAAVIVALETGDDLKRSAAIIELGHRGKAAIPHLVAGLAKDEGGFTRGLAVASLERIAEQGFPVLVALAETRDGSKDGVEKGRLAWAYDVVQARLSRQR